MSEEIIVRKGRTICLDYFLPDVWCWSIPYT